MTEAEQAIGTPDPEQRDKTDEAEAAGDAERTAPSAGDAERTVPSAGDPGAGVPAADRGRRRIAVLLAVAAFAYVLDLASKLFVVAELEHHAPVKVVGEWLQLEVIRNPGAAFGFGEAMTIVFTVIATAVIVVIARLARKLYSVPWAIALGLLLGGALGNLTDRVFRAPGGLQGAVVDFIAPAHFAVFNLADSAIVCGGFLIVILSFRGLDPDGTVHQD
ncbi:signal peptidase II [Streptomyces sp. XD-27]|uniref:signal peptidase II n=1 Tax=Streptomyces sp. XD-27 TaxID=3062779 RepID=UPI0026F40A1F|nr:signal peptidase II [Streptomyces sp. XD-27]WKX69820.1 signal peptidase II [Streptomyces sp. XD-27]